MKMKKYMTVSDVEQQDPRHPIWALNGSSRSEIGQAGDVHIGIPKVNGGTKIDALSLPQTFLPQRITDQIPYGQLVASSEFRNAVNSKLMLLITPEYAQHLLAGPGVSEEQSRLKQLDRAVREATAARSITQSGAEIVNTSDIENNEPEAKTKSEVSPQFIMYANSLKDKTDIEAINSIRSRGSVSRRECRHLARLLTNKPQTLSFLKAKLAK